MVGRVSAQNLKPGLKTSQTESWHYLWSFPNKTAEAEQSITWQGVPWRAARDVIARFSYRKECKTRSRTRNWTGQMRCAYETPGKTWDRRGGRSLRNERRVHIYVEIWSSLCCNFPFMVRSWLTGWPKFPATLRWGGDILPAAVPVCYT